MQRTLLLKKFDGKKFEMIMTYHPHNLEIQNMISKCSNFKSQLLDVKG